MHVCVKGIFWFSGLPLPYLLKSRRVFNRLECCHRSAAVSLVTAGVSSCNNSPLYKREGNWAELTLAKTPGTVTRDRDKNRPVRP